MYRFAAVIRQIALVSFWKFTWIRRHDAKRPLHTASIENELNVTDTKTRKKKQSANRDDGHMRRKNAIDMWTKMLDHIHDGWHDEAWDPNWTWLQSNGRWEKIKIYRPYEPHIVAVNDLLRSCQKHQTTLCFVCSRMRHRPTTYCTIKVISVRLFNCIWKNNATFIYIHLHWKWIHIQI